MIINPSELHPDLHDEAAFYISGPMTGYPNFNYHYFDSIAGQLRLQGFNILSPAEIDKGVQLSKDERYKKPYSYYLKKAMLMMCEADAIIMLAGWTKSKGARAELAFILDCGMPAFRLDPDSGYGLSLVELDAGLELEN